MSDVVPAMVVEIRSPVENWGRTLRRVAKFLAAGVQAVCVLDEKEKNAVIFYEDRMAENLYSDDNLVFPDALGGDTGIRVRDMFIRPAENPTCTAADSMLLR